jgi:NADH-quinone oxidoreductase subunit F
VTGFTPRLLTRPAGSGRETLDEYRASGGYEALRAARVRGEPEAVVRAVAQAGLRGRGGAAFPAARKWELARAAEETQRYVVANGGEHEPGSLKDRHLLTHHPHAVLEGTALCAFATGASVAWLYVVEDLADAIASVRAALEEASAAGVLGGLEVRLQLAPPTYVAGEETAALEVIEGRRAWPRKKPPYPGERGLFGKPTTVNNVETLAHVPWIVRHGPEAWGNGSALFTLDGSVKRPGVYELPLGGATIRGLLEGAGGGTRGGAPVKAVLPALSCAFLPGSALDTPLDHDALRAARSSLGCGSFSVIEEGTCVVERVAEIARFFMREQCGQCPACRMETNTLAAVMEKVRTGNEPGDWRGQVEKIVAFARGKGFCSLTEMAATPLFSAIRLFPGDFDHHARTGRCP